MKLLIFSDVHSNYYAVKSFFNKLKKQYTKDTQLYFLGDYIGYLKFDKRVINIMCKMIKEYDMKMLMGNHDAAFFNFVSNTNIDINVSEAIVRTINNNKKYKEDIIKLSQYIKHNLISLKLNGSDTILSHGGISDIYNHYYYPDLGFLYKYKNYFQSNTNYICGHTHRPFIYKNSDNQFINVGSIGFPRDHDPRMSYLLIDKNLIKIKRQFYPLDQAYDYNIDMPNNIKNKIYFGGNSKYLEVNINHICDISSILKKNFNQCVIYKRAIYISYKGILWQLFSISNENNIKKILLRNSKEEKIYQSIDEVMGRILNENI